MCAQKPNKDESVDSEYRAEESSLQRREIISLFEAQIKDLFYQIRPSVSVSLHKTSLVEDFSFYLSFSSFCKNGISKTPPCTHDIDHDNEKELSLIVVLLLPI